MKILDRKCVDRDDYHSRGKRFLFVLQFDSFVKTLVPVIKWLTNEGHQCTVILYKQFLKRNWLDRSVRRAMDTIPYQIAGTTSLYHELRKKYDVLIIGTILHRILWRLAQHIEIKKYHTKIVCGYVGALLNTDRQGFLRGVFRRAHAHLIWTPGAQSRDMILDTGFIDTSMTSVVPTGLPRFDELFQRILDWQKTPTPCTKDTILFIEQPTFPASRSERIALVYKLAALARAHPDKKVVMKPRFAKKTGHAHRPRYLLQDIIARFREKPENLIVSYAPFYDHFQHACMAFTISSTGGLETLLAGIPTYFVNDFCRGCNRYGSSYFTPLNAVTSFENILNNTMPSIDYRTLQHMVRSDGLNTRRLVDELLTLAGESKK